MSSNNQVSSAEIKLMDSEKICPAVGDLRHRWTYDIEDQGRDESASSEATATLHGDEQPRTRRSLRPFCPEALHLEVPLKLDTEEIEICLRGLVDLSDNLLKGN